MSQSYRTVELNLNQPHVVLVLQGFAADFLGRHGPLPDAILRLALRKSLNAWRENPAGFNGNVHGRHGIGGPDGRRIYAGYSGVITGIDREFDDDPDDIGRERRFDFHGFRFAPCGGGQFTERPGAPWLRWATAICSGTASFAPSRNAGRTYCRQPRLVQSQSLYFPSLCGAGVKASPETSRPCAVMYCDPRPRPDQAAVTARVFASARKCVMPSAISRALASCAMRSKSEAALSI